MRGTPSRARTGTSAAPAARAPRSRATPALHLVERMDAAGRRPEDVAAPERVSVAVGDDVDLALEHVVRLLEGVVVRVRDRARLVVDHEHRVQLRVEPLVDEHLDRDAAVRENGGRHACGHGRRADSRAFPEHVEIHLPLAEQEEIAVARVAHVERLRRRVRRRTEEERVAPVGARARRGHLDPPRRAVGAERVRHADGYNAAGARLQLHAAAVEIERGRALEHVQARLERVHVCVDVAVGEGDERERHVRRTERAADEAAAAQPGRVAGKRLGKLDVLAAHETVRRHAVGEVPRPGLPAHAPAPSPTSADAATVPAIPSCPASPSGSRSAPRT